MRASVLVAAFGIALAGAGAGAASAQEALGVIKHRQSVMKEQGKDLTAVKAYLDGKGDIAHAQAGADNLLKTIPAIPSVFPQKTSEVAYPGKTNAKPKIWTEWNQFTAAQQNALSKAQALDAAVKTGNKTAIQTAFADLGKNGCNGCHNTFRTPPQK